ncbi:hypothetical protein F5J12DRAFT_726778 [Pisolithus orientalis]|uniref:uncharacterized protein n=1 Tax=Pisolithus orientalis TaxID=936130 RepID=UPI002223F556|nr:uncharacterized protein F5J12DRAFT_726778 [Pisolithus orientalis]KAI5993052.1 hypothetical protein F5J12DRAFT_726778 [Pisolithus orientalis]
MDDAAQFNACVRTYASSSGHADCGQVYNLIQLIPPQKVTSCGHIAKLAGVPR